MYWLLTIALLAGIYTVLGRCVLLKSRKSKAVRLRGVEVLAGRPSLTAEEFSEKFYRPNLRPVATFIRKQLETDLIVDASKIHPEDHLFSDLGFAQLDGLDANYLDVSIRREYGTTIRPLFETTSDPTVGDVIEYVASNLPT